ncbi:hypothetical protein YC2023_082117 [Brassica napus]
MDQVEPELKEVEERTKELLEPEGTNDKDLEVPIGPMTRLKQARFRQALHQFLHTIQGNLEDVIISPRITSSGIRADLHHQEPWEKKEIRTMESINCYLKL